MEPAMRTTWDGLPVSAEPPFGATVVVFRRHLAHTELLLLHRAHHGPDYEGDWAWTPPAGARLPGEEIAACAARELAEETGLALPLVPTRCGTPDWYLYLAEAPPSAPVVLDAEHDRYVWVNAGRAPALCQPDLVAQQIAAAVQLIDAAVSG
jgi:8-oxo-dGTP pyrophosphatase MutT (NUDIX family)